MKTLKLAMLSSLIALTAFQATAETAAKDEDENIEVVSVKGQLPLIHFRNQMFSAEENFYDLYNSLTDNSSYKVICSKEIQTNSRIRKRVCEPQYMKEVRSELTGESLESGENGSINQNEFEARIASIQAKANADMAKRVEADPELKKKFYAYYQAKQKYEQKRTQEFKKD